MELSRALLKDFAKAVNGDSKAAKTSTSVNGTAVVDKNGKKFVQIDGSEQITPISELTDVQNGDRVLVSIENHQAIVLGNYTYPPSARTANSALAAAESAITEFTAVKADMITTDTLSAKLVEVGYITAEQANIAYGKITELESVAITTENFEAKAAEINLLTVDQANANYLTATQADLKYATIDELNAKTVTAKEIEAAAIEAGFIKAEDITADDGSFNYLKSVNLDAKYATIEYLDSKVVSTDTLLAEVARVGYLKVDEADLRYATIAVLESDYATIDKLESEYATLAKLEADYATIAQLNVQTGRIDVLTGDFAEYKNIVAADILAAKGWMVEGSIGDAQISSVSANKLTAGTIDTTKVSILGSDGRLQIQDNTLQISDTNRVRVQIGKDGSGDYSMSVWDQNGNLIWDALGATENTIQRAIIRDSMVSDNAAIQAMKIDFQSFETALTEQGVSISGTVVQVGDKTLNIALSEQTQSLQDYTDNAIDNIDIGGKNLLIRSQTLEGYLYHSDGSLTSGYPELGAMTTFISIVPGETYTFSRKAGSGDYFRFNWYDQNQQYINRKAVREIASGAAGTYTWTAPSNAYYIKVSYPWAEESAAKLEKGDIATDWTPAPEDVQSQLDSHETRIAANERSILLAVTSQTFEDYKTSVDARFITTESSISMLETSIVSKVEQSYVDTAISNVETIATQTATMFNWLVEGNSGDITSLTLTDKMTELITDRLIITDSTGSSTIITGGTMNINEIFAQDITATGTIRGVKLEGAYGSFSGSITATEGFIGGWNILSTCLYNDVIDVEGNIYTTVLQNVSNMIYLTEFYSTCSEITPSTSEFSYAVRVTPTGSWTYINTYYTFSVKIPTDRLVNGTTYTIYIYDGYNKVEGKTAVYSVGKDSVSTDNDTEDDTSIDIGDGFITLPEESVDPTIEFDAPGDTGSTTAKLNKYVTFTYNENYTNYRLIVGLKDTTAGASYDFIFSLASNTDTSYEDIVVSDGLDPMTVLGVKHEDVAGNITTPFYLLRDGTIYTESGLTVNGGVINFTGANGNTWKIDGPGAILRFHRNDVIKFQMGADGSFYANGNIWAEGGYLYSTSNGNTVQIGSQDQYYCHITNSESRAFLFSNSVYSQANIKAENGYLYSTSNGNTVQIGSQNSTWCHFNNSADIPFYFNKSIHSAGGFTVYGTTTSLTSGKLAIGNGSYNQGYIELYGGTPYIDFHYNNSTVDYTSRIIESSSGTLSINNLSVSSTSAQLVNSSAVEVNYRLKNSAKNVTFVLTGDGRYGIWDASLSKWQMEINSAGSAICMRSYTLVNTQVQLYGANYGVMLRNDNSAFYILLTNSGNAQNTTGWNSLRPFTINLTSGNVTIGHALSVTSTITSSNLITSSTGGSQCELRATNNYGSVALLVSTASNLGMYDVGRQRWVVKHEPEGRLKIGDKLCTAYDEISTDNAIRPTTANVYSCGTSTYPFSKFYAKSTTIGTSDEREKYIITNDLTGYSELFMSLEPIAFKWTDDVTDSKIHFGLGAQTTIRKFAEFGLNALDYEIVQYDVLEEPTETGQMDRYGMSYQDLQMLTMMQTQKNTREIERLTFWKNDVEYQIQQLREENVTLKMKIAELEALVA